MAPGKLRGDLRQRFQPLWRPTLDGNFYPLSRRLDNVIPHAKSIALDPRRCHPQLIIWKAGSDLILSFILAMGAPLEDSNAVGIGGDETDNSVSARGAVYVRTVTP